MLYCKNGWAVDSPHGTTSILQVGGDDMLVFVFVECDASLLFLIALGLRLMQLNSNRKRRPRSGKRRSK